MPVPNLSALPQIETLLQEPKINVWFPLISRPLTLSTIRETLDKVREEHLADERKIPGYGELIERIEESCAKLYQKRVRRVINCTGIILHTNMGRSPIGNESWRSAEGLNCGYSNLELRLDTGKRGKRNGLIPALLSHLVGSESSLVVNNNAAAVFLILSVFAEGKEVVVSRGEQVQIGGGFRIPEILELSGAKLVEVGTTNITTAEDYRRGITENTAVILQVHRSNFALRGFTRTPGIEELASVKPRGVILCCDQGSGNTRETLPGERKAKALLDGGSDLVCFSADKLLGGPQAGCIAGRQELIRRLENHPLMRVFRPGKTIYSLLEDVLIRRLNGEASAVERVLSLSLDDQKKRGRKVLQGLKKGYIETVPSECTPGGGSSPDECFPSLSLELRFSEKADNIMGFFRNREVPVIGTVKDDRVLLNLATLAEADIPYLKTLLKDLIDREEACSS